MGGYNTFCEILSFDKPALIVPRIVPRQEQFIRATRAEELGLAERAPDDGLRSPASDGGDAARLAAPAAAVAPMWPGCSAGWSGSPRWPPLARRRKPPIARGGLARSA